MSVSWEFSRYCNIDLKTLLVWPDKVIEPAAVDQAITYLTSPTLHNLSTMSRALITLEVDTYSRTTLPLSAVGIQTYLKVILLPLTISFSLRSPCHAWFCR